jgi:hypothetical protein
MPCRCQEKVPAASANSPTPGTSRSFISDLLSLALWPASLARDRRLHRQQICAKCRFRAGAWCGSCGCYLPLKQAGARSHCPLHKWPGDPQFPRLQSAFFSFADTSAAGGLTGATGLLEEDGEAATPVRLGASNFVERGARFGLTYWYVRSGDLVFADADQIAYARLKPRANGQYEGTALRNGRVTRFRSGAALARTGGGPPASSIAATGASII